jgi:AAA domain
MFHDTNEYKKNLKEKKRRANLEFCVMHQLLGLLLLVLQCIKNYSGLWVLALLYPRFISVLLKHTIYYSFYLLIEGKNHLFHETKICEEAGEVFESHLLISLTEQTEHLIMIGDHQQLRPKVEEYKLSVDSGQGYPIISWERERRGEKRLRK